MIGVYKLSSARKLSSGGSARLSRDLAYKCAPLAVLATVFASIALGSSLNIGHRHILPIYPVLYVAAGGISSWAVLFPRRGALLVCLIMGCFLTSSATAYPHYLAYFNSFVPSNRAYKCLIDSNLDWGQDLPGLKSRLDSLLANGKVPVYLNYFGKGSPSYYGVRAIELPPKFDDLVPFRWEAGLYCVSATALQLGDEQSQRWTRAEEARYQELRRTYRGPCAMSTPTRDDDNIKPDLRKLRSQLEFGEFLRMMSYLRHREPDELVGYSILIFRLTEDEVALALRGNSEAVIEELR